MQREKYVESGYVESGRFDPEMYTYMQSRSNIA